MKSEIKHQFSKDKGSQENKDAHATSAATAHRSARRKKSVRTRKNKSKNTIFLGLAAFVVIGAAIFILQYDRKMGGYQFEGEAAQYYAGQAFTIPSGAHMNRSADSSTIFGEHLERDAGSLPIYYKDRNVVVLPTEVVYVAPREGIVARIDRFAELIYQDSGASEVQKKRRKKALQQGFVFDGDNLYLFLEPVTVQFNGYELKLGAMSYIEANFNGDIVVYNHSTGEMLIEAPKGPVVASVDTEDYSVSLLADSMTMHDGTKTLLFNRPDLLEGLL